MAEQTIKKEITLADALAWSRHWLNYLFSQWLLILAVGFICGIIGLTYAWLQKPLYKATLTFVPEGENASPLSAYASIASQFGIDIGSGRNNFFEGENLAEIMRSDMMLQRTLFSPVSLNNKNLLVNYYIKVNKIDEDEQLKGLKFTDENAVRTRTEDSVLGEIIKKIKLSPLDVSRLDKKVTIWGVGITTNDEVFSKNFVEQLTNNTIDYYVDYKSRKARTNVAVLQHQLDSVKAILSGKIVDVAVINDLNINPTRQISKATTTRKQIDVQANTILYGELLKQLEVGKVLMLKETPFIQVLDTPKYPLEKKKLGRLKGAIIFAFIGSLLFTAFLIIRKEYNRLTAAIG